jgi:hypothetical protein
MEYFRIIQYTAALLLRLPMRTINPAALEDAMLRLRARFESSRALVQGAYDRALRAAPRVEAAASP